MFLFYPFENKLGGVSLWENSYCVVLKRLISRLITAIICICFYSPVHIKVRGDRRKASNVWEPYSFSACPVEVSGNWDLKV